MGSRGTRLDLASREQLIRQYLHAGRDGRAKLMASMVRPTGAVLAEPGPVARAVRATELLSMLDRLDAAMGPDELRAAPDLVNGSVFGTPEVENVPLTFDNWRALLRRAVEDAVREDPEVANLIPVAEVMDA